MQLNYVHIILVRVVQKWFLILCGLYWESNRVYGFLFEFENTYSWTYRLLSLFWFCCRLQKEELKCAKHDVIHKVRCYLKCMRKIFGKYADVRIFVHYTYRLSYCLLLLWFHCTGHGWSCSWCLQ